MNIRFAASKDKPMIVAKENILPLPFNGVPHEHFPSPWLTISFGEFEALTKAMAYVINKRYHLKPQSRVAIIANSLPMNQLLSMALWYLRIIIVEITPKIGNDVKQCWMRMLNMSMGFYDCVFKPFSQDHKGEEEWIWPWIYPTTPNEHLESGNGGILMVDTDSESFKQEILDAKNQGLTYELEGNYDDLINISGTSSSAQAIIKNGQSSEMKFVGFNCRKAGNCYEKYLYNHLPVETNFLLVSPYHHSLGICKGMLHPIYDGGPLVYRTQNVDDVGIISEMLLDDIAEIDINETLIFSFQFAEWKKLKEAGHPKWPYWERAIKSKPIGCFHTGGAPPIPEVTKWLAKDLHIFCSEQYGSSESGIMMYTNGEPPLRGEEGYLKRVPFVDIYLEPLNDEDPNIGEVFVCSDQNFTGYVKRLEGDEICKNSLYPGLRVDAKADECFKIIDGKKFYKSNDIFRRSPLTGNYKFISRTDDVIAFSTGLKMNPVPFERTMVQFCKNIKLCCLLLDTTATEVVCFVEPEWKNILLDNGEAFDPNEHLVNTLSKDKIHHLSELAKTQIWDSIYAVLMDDSQSLTNWVKQLTKNNVVIIGYGDKFPTTDKGSLSRRVARMKYSEILNQISKIIQGEEAINNDQAEILIDTLASSTIDNIIKSEESYIVQDNPDFSGEYQERIISIIYQSIKEIIPSTPEIEEFDPQKAFTMYGIDSLSTVKLTNILSRKLKKHYSPSIIFNCATPLLLAQYLARPKQTVPIQNKQIASEKESKSNAIAIIGMGLRLPGAINSDKSLWSALVRGRNCISPLPKDRKLHQTYVAKPSNELNKNEHNVKYYGYYDSRTTGEKVSQFDAEFFNCLPDEAVGLDPKHRWILETSWEALENAGISPDSLQNSNTGVFVGIGDQQDHAKLMQECKKEKVISYHNSNPSAIAGRLSYFYNIYGPSVTVDTACSTGATALHTACRSMLYGDCDVAIVTASKYIFYAEEFELTSKSKMTSPSGRCATFDKEADGYAPAEGCVTFILKRLEAAEKNNDSILGVILSTSSGQSGIRQSISVPSSEGQARNIQRVLDIAGVKPSDISYIEAHGTGTPYGDAIEIHGINQVFAGSHTPDNPLYIGSIKTNIGHTFEPAGLAGIAKVLVSLKNKIIPRHLHFKTLNPEIDIKSVPLAIPLHNIKWESENDKPRTALVSSYGLQGSVVNIIIQEYIPKPKKVDKEEENLNYKQSVEKKLKFENIRIREKYLLTISARDKAALLELSNKYCNILDSMDYDESIQNLCYTSNVGRQHFENRLIAVGENVKTLSINLQEAIDQMDTKTTQKLSSFIPNYPNSPTNRKFYNNHISMIFNGNYNQTNLITDEMYKFACYLYRTQPVYAKALEECDKIIAELTNFKLLLVNLIICMATLELDSYNLLHEYKKQVDEDPCIAQFIRLSMNYALTQYFHHLSIPMNLCMGDEFGEVSAALACHKISLKNAFVLIQYICKQLCKNIQDKTEETLINDLKQLMIMKVDTEKNLTLNNSYSNTNIDMFPLESSQVFYSNTLHRIFTHDQSVGEEQWVQYVKTMVNTNSSSFQIDYKNVLQKYNFGNITFFIHASPSNIVIDNTIAHRTIFGIKGTNPYDNFINILCDLYTMGKNVNWTHFHERFEYETQKPYALEKISLPFYPFQRKYFWPLDKKNEENCNK